jgi:hypothetical protein
MSVTINKSIVSRQPKHLVEETAVHNQHLKNSQQLPTRNRKWIINHYEPLNIIKF